MDNDLVFYMLLSLFQCILKKRAKRSRSVANLRVITVPAEPLQTKIQTPHSAVIMVVRQLITYISHSLCVSSHGFVYPNLICESMMSNEKIIVDMNLEFNLKYIFLLKYLACYFWLSTVRAQCRDRISSMVRAS